MARFCVCCASPHPWCLVCFCAAEHHRHRKGLSENPADPELLQAKEARLFELSQTQDNLIRLPRPVVRMGLVKRNFMGLGSGLSPGAALARARSTTHGYDMEGG